MTWHEAVAFNNIIGIVLLIFWASVPVMAILSMVWRRHFCRGVRSLFAVTVLLSWIGLTAVWLLIAVNGAFYTEGASQQRQAILLSATTLALAILNIVFVVIGVLDFRRASRQTAQ